jgi:hypothetical protein
VVLWNRACRLSHRSVLVTTTFVAVLGVFVSGCGALLQGAAPRCGAVACPTTYKELTAMPISHLYYPGAHVICRVGAGYNQNGSGSAYAGAYLWTPARPSAIYAFYEHDLLSKGWRHCPAVADSSNDISTMTYAKGRWQLIPISIDNRRALSEGVGKLHVPKGATIYSFTYFYGPPQVECFAPIPGNS